MKIFMDIRFYFVVVSLSFLVLMVKYWNQQDALMKCQTDKYSIQGGDIQSAEMRDSLFYLRTTLDRYEIAHEMLKEEDSLCAQKFENILYTKTE